MSVGTLEIFASEPLQHESERIFLKALMAHLEAKGEPAVILCGVQLGGRQIDFVVSGARGLAVVEVKVTSLPIYGDITGYWERLTASGERVRYRNPYTQAVDAKHALRDAIAKTTTLGNYYPDAFVVFVRPLPEGSVITSGDKKARLGTTDEFMTWFDTLSGNPLTAEQSRDFAAQLRLAPRSLDAVLGSPNAWQLAERIDRYKAGYLTEHGPDAQRWQAESPEHRDNLLAAARLQAGAFIEGPTGCGKTLVAKWLSIQLSNDGICFLFSVTDFSGSWSDTIRRELSLMADIDDPAFIGAVSRQGIPITFVFDGLNELSPSLANRAVRGIRALGRRYGARVIVTSQQARPDTLSGLTPIKVSAPTEDLKLRIATDVGGGITAAAKEILAVVSSGFEAKLVGEVGAGLPAPMSRLNLIDQFARTRLSEHARSATLGLRRLATRLVTQLAYTIGETQFDELMHSLGVSFNACDAMFQAQILTRRGGRIAFNHELYLSAFAAHEFADRALVDPVQLGKQLDSPLFAALAKDTLSAIESADVAEAVLSAIHEAEIIAEAARGGMGPAARVAAHNLLRRTHQSLIEEIGLSRLVLTSGEAFSRLHWEGGVERSPEERARISAIGRLASDGTDVESYQQLCRAMDAKLAEQRLALADAARAAKVSLRSESFAMTYLGLGDRHSFTSAANASDARFPDKVRTKVTDKRPLSDLTSGELLFALHQRYSRYEDGQADRVRFANELATLIRTRWKQEPYHVHLELLNVVGFARDVDDDTRRDLIAAVETIETGPSNWAINSSIIDALKILGGLDDEAEGQRASIREDVARAAGPEDSDETRQLARSVYNRMFDHPFDFVYGEEIYALSEAAQGILFRRALQVVDEYDTMSTRYLAQRVADNDDPADAPLFLPLAVLPSQKGIMPQEEVATFVTATRFLGRHHVEIPPPIPANDAQRCMAVVQSLIQAAETEADTTAIWDVIAALPAAPVFGCLAEVNDALLRRNMDGPSTVYPAIDLAARYATELLGLSRRLLDSEQLSASYHQVASPERDVGFAIGVVARHGDRGDTIRLQKLTSHPLFARSALEALRVVG